MADTGKQPAAAPASGESGNVTADERGRTTIAVGVVEKIAGMAAREVDGIHALGSGSRFGAAVREKAGGRSVVQRGVKAEVGERQAALDVDLVVEYGVVIPAVAGSVRRHIIRAVENMTGLEVVEVNVAVTDVHLPDEPDEDDSRESRVQ